MFLVIHCAGVCLSKISNLVPAQYRLNISPVSNVSGEHFPIKAANKTGQSCVYWNSPSGGKLFFFQCGTVGRYNVTTSTIATTRPKALSLSLSPPSHRLEVDPGL